MKPARKQIDDKEYKALLAQKNSAPVAGAVYNIWHHKWRGGKREEVRREHAKYRCKVERDAGETRGSNNPESYFCIYFAQGMCAQGPECACWHRIPIIEDTEETTIDCFGRDKFSEFREDMGGVGAFSVDSKTLYVGRIKITEDMEDIVRRHFGEWGDIENVKVLRDKGVAFVTYYTRSSAEFAKEAMTNQSLDHDEILNVRWATEDPNPRVGTSHKRKTDHASRQVLESTLPAEFTRPILEVDEDGFQNSEMRAKRTRAEAAERDRHPGGMDPYQAYHYQQQQLVEQGVGYQLGPDGQYYYVDGAAATATQEEGTGAGIVSQQALETLARLAGTVGVGRKVREEGKEDGGKKVTGLVLADYGSSDEE
ncbi:hypothetical protein BC938DRAFT_479894 [Jimgerdemannia flammicorona]|uniref:RRM domain-containing protein n=1 Tax=Jimgerdemannia flammicorona TaxID=994334 RepID=A0A433QJU6_9FUNG|nr:hypothetical protein BC938DRAFT_479894 [Jimgerdemannia flammicorona]